MKRKTRKKSTRKSARRPSFSRSFRQYEQRLKNLLELSSDWYWEQDEQFRFTVATGSGLEKAGIDPKIVLGKVRWVPSATPLRDKNWDNFKALVEAHQSFSDFVYRNVEPDGTERYLCVSGQPMFDARGRFKGYHGIAKDITQRIRMELRAAIDHGVTRVLAESSGLAEAASGIIQVFCETLGWTCGALWQVDERERAVHCAESWGVASPEIDTLLAQNDLLSFPASTLSDALRRTCMEGEPLWIQDIGRQSETPSAAHAFAAGLRSAFWFPIVVDTEVVGFMEFFSREQRRIDTDLLHSLGYIGKQIGQFYQRTRSEQSRVRLGRMFAALSATNEAILRAKSPEELYQKVCDDAVHGSKFLVTAIFIAEPGTKSAIMVGGAGPGTDALLGLGISMDESQPGGRGLIGNAFRLQKPAVSNDFQNDERLKPWHQVAREKGFAAAAAMPLIRSGQSVGVLIFYSAKTHTFDDEMLTLLQRMSENVSFALDNFQREAERRETEERMKHMARHDSLTSLPNRAMFSELLNLALRSAERYKRSFAVLFIDLDGFKTINDTLGHEAGDILLKEMSTRLTQVLRSSDVVARLGGDEFVVLLQEVNEEKYVTAIAEKILDVIMAPVVIKDRECHVTASVGICMYPDGARDEQSLMKNADKAMYRAKEKGKNNFEFFSA